MDILTVSRKIELLLRSLTSPTALYSDSVRCKPYETIMSVLRSHLPRGAKKFEEWYEPTKNKSMSQLQEEGYDFEIIIGDLERIISGKI